jgi:Ca2+-binding RTX toxin-like protein
MATVPGTSANFFSEDEQRYIDSFLRGQSVIGQDLNDRTNADDLDFEPATDGFDQAIINVKTGTVDMPGDIEGVTLRNTDGDGRVDVDANSLDNLVVGSNEINKIRLGSGDDIAIGRGGNDSLQGDAGDDTLSGGTGRDYLSGGTGDDKLFGGDDSDVLKGGDDQDTLFGGSGNDDLDGGANNDRLYGESGDDTLTGMSGNDALFGGEGKDTLFGGEGNDTLFGGAGSDTLTGGSGNDVFEMNNDGSRDVITDFSPTSDKIDLSETGLTKLSDLTIKETTLGGKDGVLLTSKDGKTKFFVEGDFKVTDVKDKWFLF